MFISFIFFLTRKHVYNRKKIARITIWGGGRDYIDQIRIVAADLNIWENNIFLF